MLKIANEPTFTRPVKCKVPVGDGFEEETFKATFRVIDVDATEDFNFLKPGEQTKFLKRVIVTLDELGDATGKAKVEYSDEVRDQVIRLPWARSALTKTYFDGVNGAAEGN